VNSSSLNRLDDDDVRPDLSFDGMANPALVPDSIMKTPVMNKNGGRDSMGSIGVVSGAKLTMIPSSSHNPIWSGFFWSVEKDKHGRRTAQCKFCNLVLGGRPMRLKRHFLVPAERCSQASDEFIEYYKNLVK
jgi:hypothetical protein